MPPADVPTLEPAPAPAHAAVPPTVGIAPARLSTTTVLEVRPLDSESPSDEPLQYHWPLAFFTTEHVPGCAAWPDAPVDVSHAGSHEGTADAAERGAGPRWRVSLSEDVMAASLDEDVEGTRLRIVKLKM